MITLAYVLELPKSNSNLFTVRIPIFEQPGGDICKMSANLAYNPGNLNGYKVNDIVAVGFLDNRMQSPIIIGKLLTNETQKATNYSLANSLNVEESAKLPENTVIGNLSYSDLTSLKRKVDNLWDFMENYQKRII